MTHTPSLDLAHAAWNEADAHGFTPQAIAEMEPIVQARAAIARVEGK